MALVYVCMLLFRTSLALESVAMSAARMQQPTKVTGKLYAILPIADSHPMYESNTDNTMRLKIIGNARIKNVGQSQSCMVSKLPMMIFNGTRRSGLYSLRSAAVSNHSDHGVLLTMLHSLLKHRVWSDSTCVENSLTCEYRLRNLLVCGINKVSCRNRRAFAK